MITYSDEHKEYLKKNKRDRFIIFTFRLLIIVLLLSLWEFLARFHLINTFLSSSFTNVIKTCLNLMKDGSLFNHILITLYEVLISFFISFVIGLVVASILWSNNIISKIINN